MFACATHTDAHTHTNMHCTYTHTHIHTRVRVRVSANAISDSAFEIISVVGGEHCVGSGVWAGCGRGLVVGSGYACMLSCFVIALECGVGFVAVA